MHDHSSRPGPKATHAAVAELPSAAESRSRPGGGLFSGLTKDEIAEILASGVLRKFPAGHIIVRTNEPTTHFYLLKRGTVDYYRTTPEGRQVLIIRLFPGETFGLGSLLSKPCGYIGTAETGREAEVYVWEHTWVRAYVKKHPALAENALRICLEYIKLYSDRHLALVTTSAEDRLTRTLMLLGHRVGHHNPKGLEIKITNEHLASLADIGSYTASRLLNKWERQGAVEKTRGKVVLHCPEKMLPKEEHLALAKGN